MDDQRNRAVPVPPTGTAASGPPDGTVRYSVPEAARALGISERAVRKRIDAHTLFAVREGRSWCVYLPGGTAEVPEPAVPTAEPAVPPDPVPEPDAVPAAVPGGTDLRPLVDLVERQAAEIQRLTEAATTWQLRASL